MILRLLLAIAFFGLIVFLFKRVVNSFNKAEPAKKIDRFDDTVACHKCGLRLPKQEAIEANGHYYCCREHADT